ncbi:NusA family KH domain protein [Euryarchaeota archaeon ex4484_162]|nr:NusA-like transcription termination signal-binding factor [Thermoplasmata archaeon]OYT58553.1 MAG: NusA family KH domain protein [Euryarchaeota archaeon ex4484_162]RLF62371.1 MAG: NusA-like transcription termination signal-binding factor [Thermoplasmata archaeon]
MGEITFSRETLQYINIAARLTKCNIIDCLDAEDRVVFVVEKGQLGLAIGNNARNIERLKKVFNKNVKFVEYDSDREKFIYNLFKPFKVMNVKLEERRDGSYVAKIEVDIRDKSKAIGKNGRNIEIIRKLAQRHHPISDVQIV